MCPEEVPHSEIYSGPLQWMCARGVPWSELTVDRYRACALKGSPGADLQRTGTVDVR